jgi:cell division protein FtsI/penicillin-binding protein 2
MVFSGQIFENSACEMINACGLWEDMNMNRNRNQNRGFGVITVVLILAILFLVKGTVFSREQDGRAEANRYYSVLEKEYLRQTKDMLEQDGYDNCGVTVTWVAAEDGSREYTVCLHHRKLQKLSRQEQTVMIDRLSEMEFDRESCSFTYSIL